MKNVFVMIVRCDPNQSAFNSNCSRPFLSFSQQAFVFHSRTIDLQQQSVTPAPLPREGMTFCPLHCKKMPTEGFDDLQFRSTPRCCITSDFYKEKGKKHQLCDKANTQGLTCVKRSFQNVRAQLSNSFLLWLTWNSATFFFSSRNKWRRP